MMWADWRRVMDERQLTEAEAIEICDSGCWAEATKEDLALTQLTQERLFCPFGEFHEAVEALLGRSVWTHEFVDSNGLLDEYMGKREKPTAQEIMGLFPEHVKVIPIIIEGGE